MNTARFREGFQALRQQTYLSVCDKMILHDAVGAAVNQFLTRLSQASASRVDHENQVDACRRKVATLLRVKPQEIAVGRNVSDGINAVIWSLDLQPGDNVVVCLDLEHPNNIYPWLRLRERGVDIRSVPHKDGHLDVTALIAAMDGNTRILSCASVSFAPGHRADLERIGKATRDAEVFFLVDGVQSAGILSHDLHAENVDGFATSTSKGLLGLYGYGYLFVSERWIDRMQPAYLSRPAIEMNNDDASAVGDHDYRLKPSAARFEVGSYNLAGAYASNAALDLLADLGTDIVEKQALGVADDLRRGLIELGMPDVTPGDANSRATIVTAGEMDAGGHGFSHTAWVTTLSTALSEARIAHTVRRGQLRFGTHAYNTSTDVNAVLDVVKSTGLFA